MTTESQAAIVSFSICGTGWAAAVVAKEAFLASNLTCGLIIMATYFAGIVLTAIWSARHAQDEMP